MWIADSWCQKCELQYHTVSMVRERERPNLSFVPCEAVMWWSSMWLDTATMAISAPMKRLGMLLETKCVSNLNQRHRHIVMEFTECWNTPRLCSRQMLAFCSAQVSSTLPELTATRLVGRGGGASCDIGTPLVSASKDQLMNGSPLAVAKGLYQSEYSTKM